ncbi:RHS repeat domain-containing protein [Steroidobacter flavus]|uniref:RHS repeat domain-containing protein n=1 Tax=Steroidobacter flavus TaxID=1842136 RepID=A0ABV8T3G8_9GAMM
MTNLMQAGRALGALCRILIASLALGGVWGTALAGELVTYYHNDVAGSPIAATDSKGYYIWRSSYEPYGQRIQNDAEYAASIDNNRWFTGHVEDVETGTLYMQARHYDPVIGRFMSVDPIRFVESEPHTFTRYAYAANNPYRYNDPDGEFINFIVGGVKAAVENVAIQHIEMALGIRDSFSWGEVAIDAAVGTATSGLSTIKNAAKLAKITKRVTNRGDDLPDSTLVCRGGTCKADQFTHGSGVTKEADGTLKGVSTQSKTGASVEELAQPFKNNKVGVTTVGDIRRAGGKIEPDGTPNNPNHATVEGLTAEKLEELFKVIDNPVPPAQRGK